MKKAAIFDIDGTIFRSSLLIELVNILIERGHFPESARTEYERDWKRWLERKGNYESYINAVVATFVKNIKGVYYGDFDKAADTVAARFEHYTYRYTRNLIKELKKKGYYLLAVSHSPKTVLDKFCDRLGFDKSYGMLYELGANDCFTGKRMEETIMLNKANVVKRAAEKEKLSLKDSIGVGDTESDIPLLELVGTPICFNPNMKLYKHAKRNGWKVVVERKDVVYEFE